MVLSERLRPPLGDQLVDQFALASIVGERAAQLLGCGAALCGRGVGRVRRPGHGLIVAGGGPASRRSRTRLLVSCCVPSLRALPLDEARELRIRPGGWRSLAPGKESVAKRSLACLAAMLQLGVLGGFPQVAREAADVPGGGRVRVAGENTMLADGELRSFASGARVLVIRQDVEKLAPGGSGGQLGPGSVDVGRVVIGTGSARVAGHVGVGDRPVSRGGAGDRVCCVPEVSRIGHAAQNRGGRLSDSGRFCRWAPRADLTGRDRNAPRVRCGLVNVAAGVDGLVRACSPRVCAAGFGCAERRVLTSRSESGARAIVRAAPDSSATAEPE